ncbi:putative CTD kinase subunit alpha, partial [Tetrabaena socialis]
VRLAGGSEKAVEARAGGDNGGGRAREAADSLRREVSILRALPPHERIARVLGGVELPGEGTCLVMAYYPYTLMGLMQSERLRRAWLTPARRACICRQLAEGLAFLHGLPGGARLIHRDLKPNNVLLEAAP